MLPPKFQWLDDIGPLPKALAVALQYNGLKEVPGLKSNPIIMEMAKNLWLDKIYKSDELSWCALFVNNALKLAEKPLPDPKGDPWNLLRARWMENWGNAVAPGNEKLGDVLIFQRPGGGHVGFYVGESKKTFHVYGGNQANAAGFTEIEKSRLVGARNYYNIGPPESVKKYFIDSTGKISTNES